VIYPIEVAPAAERQLRRLDATLRKRIGTHIQSLAEHPRPHGAKQLSARENLWRVRVGSYRVVDQVQELGRIVLILRVGHRRDVYRQLDRLREG
jgi:mRNA interferase RelE/StbE